MSAHADAPPEWWAQARGGDQRARERLILHYRPWALKVASSVARALPRRLLDDALAGATVGLIEAVDRFDPERGRPFETFARQRVRWALWDYVRRPTPLPVSLDRLLDDGFDVAEQDCFEHERERHIACAVVASLPAVDRDVLGEVGAGVPLKDYASSRGITPSAASRRYTTALAHAQAPDTVRFRGSQVRDEVAALRARGWSWMSVARVLNIGIATAHRVAA